MRFFNKQQAPPGPPETPESALRGIGTLLAAIAGVNLVAGALAVFAQWDFAIAQGGGWVSVVAGVGYGVLAFMALRGFKWAAPIGVVLFVVDSLLAVSGTLTGGSVVSIWMITRIVVAYYLIQGTRTALRPGASA